MWKSTQDELRKIIHNTYKEFDYRNVRDYSVTEKNNLDFSASNFECMMLSFKKKKKRKSHRFRLDIHL